MGMVPCILPAVFWMLLPSGLGISPGYPGVGVGEAWGLVLSVAAVARDAARGPGEGSGFCLMQLTFVLPQPSESLTSWEAGRKV